MYKICIRCGIDINYRSSRARFCSKKCKDIHWREANPDLYYKINRDWKDRNVERRLHVSRQRYSLNPGKFIAKTVAYREQKRKAMPIWLTKAQRDEIRNIYVNCPNGYQVDHIIPLHGKSICGLHVPWNLQYLTKLDNLRKGNK